MLTKKTYKIERFAIALFAKWCFLASLSLFAGIVVAANQTDNTRCAKLLDRKLFDPPHQSQDEIEEVQKCLITKGFHPGGIDGYLGPNTRAALAGYWKSINITLQKPYVWLCGIQTPQKQLTPKSASPVPIQKKAATRKKPLEAALSQPVSKQIDKGVQQLLTGKRQTVDPGVEKLRSLDGLDISYMLSADDIKKLKIASPKDVFKQIAKLKNIPFTSKTDLVSEVVNAVRKAPGNVDIYLPTVENLARQAKTLSFQLTEDSFNNLLVKKVSDKDIAKLKSIQNVAFPSKTALYANIIKRFSSLKKVNGSPSQNQAADKKSSSDLSRLLNIVKNQIQKIYSLNDKSIKDISSAPILSAKQSGYPSLASLEQLQDIEYPTAVLFYDALTSNTAPKPPVQLLMPVIHQARKIHTFNDSSHIDWDGNFCGCVRSSLSGLTYGFYPYWKSGGTQNVQFSFLSRIAYLGLSFDQSGKVSSHLDWKPDKANFINIARKHGTMVDLVIYQNNWGKWKKGSELNYPNSETLTENIVTLINSKLNNTFFNKHKALFSLGTSSTPGMGDGVTLYFANYPEDIKSSQYLVSLIRKLRKKLWDIDKEYYLNLVIPQSMIGNGIFTKEYLPNLIPDIKEGVTGYEQMNYVNLFLVPLAEPTTSNKKALRQKIEQLFTSKGIFEGTLRRNLLRKIVPVLIPNGTKPEQQKQFKDDLVYFDNNFAGVGFWPLPFSVDKASKPEQKTANKISKMAFFNLDKYFQQANAVAPSMVRDFVCVHKWFFRLSFDLMSLLLLVFGILAIFFCQVRLFWERFSWHCLAVIVLWGGLGLGILFYDPFYADIARGNIPLISIVIANILYVAWLILKRSVHTKRP